jgi:iron complex transport system ATP-binding protein
METIAPETVRKAKKRIEESICVIDTGFPLGELNQGNFDLLKTALKMGKPVFSMRKERSFSQLATSSNGVLFSCENESHLVSILEERLKESS